MTTPELSYPGVYVQEIPSGARAITGVATAVTAFLGRARRGPVDEPVAISSFGDFERRFGGLWRESGLGYAVRDYFRNGGGNALVARLAGSATPATVTLAGVTFEAREPGTWARGYTVRLRHPGLDPEAAARAVAAAREALDAAVTALHAAEGAATQADEEATAAEDASAKAPNSKPKAGTATEKRDEADAQQTAYAEAREKVAAAAAAHDRALADKNRADAHAEIAHAQGVPVDKLFDVEVLDRATDPAGARTDAAAASATGAQPTLESFPNVTFVDGPRSLGLVLRGSRLIRLADGPVPEPDLSALDLVPAPGEGTPTGPPTGGTTTSGTPTSDTATTGTATTGDLGSASGAPSSGSGESAAPSTSGTPGTEEGRPAPVERVGIGALAGGDDGAVLAANDYVAAGFADGKQGLYALEKTDLFTLLCLPPSEPSGVLPETVWAEALAYCTRRRAFLLVDPPPDETKESIERWSMARGLVGAASRNAALYFPRIRYPDPLRDGADGDFAPCGAVAGTMASTDASRGVWKAPAGLEAGLVGAGALAVDLTDAEHGRLARQVNALRAFPSVGPVVWGARTLRGADVFADDYKYVPVRRLALYLEESLHRGTQWVVFEPNDEPLWSQVRATLTAFMQDLFRQGAFAGGSPREAYFVRCDANTTTPYDVARGLVNVQVGFAPLRPAEFVVVGIQQKTADAG
ncbi:phage tail sheath C-terminal domain-containing protein [Actinomycetospora flava]|uniref:Phage tail sheath C-terminal domain-containing protein n=1 Tax=Actinomycetospora flava TaxID=3129232 RepID=A0ABU8M628_9PSEU